MRALRTLVLSVLGVLGTGCSHDDARSGVVITKALQSAPETGDLVRCVIEDHHNCFTYVQVADDTVCVKDRCGMSWCSSDWLEVYQKLRDVRQLMPNTAPLLVPETEDESRILRARQEIERPGYSNVQVCQAYSHILERVDGGYHYPRRADGRDHVCEFETTVAERIDEAEGVIERWCQFESGERSELFASFSIETGHPISVGSYRNDRKHSLWLFFDGEGELERTQWYWDDVPGSPPGETP